MSILKYAFASALLVACAAAADDAPSWLREFSTMKTPAYPPKVPAVVLLDEENVTVDDSGRITTTVRKAIKVLTRDGRKEAKGIVVYVTGSEKVRDFRAWMIRPSGEVKKYGKEQVLDVALSSDYVYDEGRERAVVGEDDADTGSVFGYEAVTEERSVFTQLDHVFQGNLPTLLSRFSLTLPAGWREETVALHGDVPVQQSGSTYTWQVRDLPYVEEEQASPSMMTLVPRVAVSYTPSESAKPNMGRVFTGGWPDVSRWLAELEDPQAAPNSEIADKVKALTASAQGELDKIRAIGHYVQTVHYVAIETGLGRGGGYKPHSAAEVFQKQYGDCKDKANLMRAMLKTAGIRAYMVSIYSGDPTYVRETWPSPQQFNHAIIAVKVSDATQSPAIADVPKLGRLLFFDPTAETVPLGDLPEHEQGSFALIDDATAGNLVKVPVIPAASNRLEREGEVVVTPEGGIQSTFRERYYGHSSSRRRAIYRQLKVNEFQKAIEKWVGDNVNGAKVSKIEPTDNFTDDRFDLNVEFSADHYAQLMQHRLLVFRPAVLSSTFTLAFRKEKRQNPVVLHAARFEETVHVKLPPGFKVDELPDSGKLDTPFGTYAASYAVKDGDLLFTRRLEIRPSTVPIEQYTALKNFFEQVGGSEQAPVVLAKD